MGVCPFCSSLSPAWAHSIIGQSGIGKSPIVQSPIVHSLIGQSQSDQRCFAVSVTDGQFVCLFCSSLSPSWAQSPIGQSPIGQSQSDQRCFAGAVRYRTTGAYSVCIFRASWEHLHSLGPSGQFGVSFLSLVLLETFIIISDLGLLCSICQMTIPLYYEVYT